LNRLEAVKKIHALSKQLKERIKAGDFSKSIALCLDCSQLIKENKDLDCVKLIDINVLNSMISYYRLLAY